VRQLNPPARTVGILTRRARGELSALQATVHALGAPRNAALRRFVASRHSITPLAQHEFWLEFSWLDQEYRAAVRRLAQFCLLHKEGSHRRLRIALTPAPRAHARPASQ
jgi:hypothetical protein